MGVRCNFLFSKSEIEKFAKIFVGFLTLARIRMCDCQMLLVPQNITGSSNRQGYDSSWS